MKGLFQNTSPGQTSELLNQTQSLGDEARHRYLVSKSFSRAFCYQPMVYEPLLTQSNRIQRDRTEWLFSGAGEREWPAV